MHWKDGAEEEEEAEEAAEGQGERRWLGRKKEARCLGLAISRNSRGCESCC